MGLLFNTEQTTKMVALINRHFGADANDGGIEGWRAQKDDVQSAKNLFQLAWDNEVFPDRSDDKYGKYKARWKKWLKRLQLEPASVSTDPALLSTTVSGYLAPNTGTFNKVDKELRRQMFNALNDTNCVEIAFSTVPDSSISIAPGQTIATTGGKFIYLVLIKTKRVDEIP